jgi:hypothetical protein
MNHYIVVNSHFRTIFISPCLFYTYEDDDVSDEVGVRAVLLSHGVRELIVAYEVRVYATRCHETNYNTPEHHQHLRDPAVIAKRARRQEERKQRKAAKRGAG